MFCRVRRLIVVLVEPVYHYIVITLLGKRKLLVAFLFFGLAVACVLSVMVCLHFLLVPLLGCDLWLWLILDLFETMFGKQITIDLF